MALCRHCDRELAKREAIQNRKDWIASLRSQ
jgi:hypothetical protein